jgi:hypothetical protein
MAVPRFALEISLADQPGALGFVASTIGAMGGDVVDIDVLEHGRGRARDEITVNLASPRDSEALVERLNELEGVEVEAISQVGEYGHHLVVDALEVAAAILDERDVSGLVEALATGVLAAFAASWVVVVQDGAPRPLAAAGGVPPASVTRAAGGPIRFADEDDRIAVPIDSTTSLVVGREGWPFRNRERRELATLGRISGTRMSQVTEPVS